MEVDSSWKQLEVVERNGRYEKKKDRKIKVIMVDCIDGIDGIDGKV